MICKSITFANGNKVLEFAAQRWHGTLFIIDLTCRLRGDHSPNISFMVGAFGFVAEVSFYDTRHEGDI